MTMPQAIKDSLPPDDRMRIGIIVSIDPVIVDVQGTLIPAGVLSSYTPVINDNVAMIRQDQTWLILGRVATSDVLGSSTLQFQAGAVDVSVVAATSASVALLFLRPFAQVPSVSTNISSGAGGIALWQSRAIGVTTTGFTVFVYTTGGAITGTVPVQWQAQEMTQ